jgi:hypothetical protein
LISIAANQMAFSDITNSLPIGFAQANDSVPPLYFKFIQDNQDFDSGHFDIPTIVRIHKSHSSEKLRRGTRLLHAVQNGEG